MSVWCSGKEGSREGEVPGSNPTDHVAARLATWVTGWWDLP
jgi:hypothetical protein